MPNITLRRQIGSASGVDQRSPHADGPRRDGAPVQQMIQIQRNHPGRRLDWRWQFAGDVVAHRRNLPATFEDEFLRQAVELKRKGRRGRATRRHPRFYEHLVHAVGIERQAGRQKALLQAWLLTEVSLDEVAKQCSLPVGVVEVFAALFFDVRDRRDAKDWILVRAIGMDRAADGRNDAGRLWRLLGYVGGSRILKDVVPAIPWEGQLDRVLEVTLLSTPEGCRRAWLHLFAAASAASKLYSPKSLVCPRWRNCART